MNRPFSKNTCIRKNRDRSSLLFMEMIQPQQTKNTLRLTKKRPPCVEKKIKIHPASPFFGDNLFIRILQKAKVLVYCIPFPFLPLFMPFSFSSPLHFHISFPKALLFFTVYTELSTLYPPYSRDFAKLSTLSTALCTFSRFLQRVVGEYLSFVYFTAFAVFLPFYAPFLCPSPSFSFTILHRQNKSRSTFAAANKPLFSLFQAQIRIGIDLALFAFQMAVIAHRGDHGGIVGAEHGVGIVDGHPFSLAPAFHGGP